MKKIILLTAILFGIFLISARISKAQEGHPPEIKVYNSQNLHIDSDFFAYDKNLQSGVSVALGDLDGDGKDEIIAGAGTGGAPQVRVFDRRGKFLGISFFAFDENYRGGVSVAAGDLNGDKKSEIIVAPLKKSQSLIKVYNHRGKKLISEFLAFDPSFRGGANVAAGDINGDGKDEIIVGAGAGGSPHVRVFNKKGKFLGFDLFPFDKNYHGGVNVAAGNLDSDKKDEIIVAPASRAQARVKVYKANRAKYVMSNFLAFSQDFFGGANIAAGDVDNDGAEEIIVGAGASGGPQIRAFETSGKPLKINFFPYDNNFRGGVQVAAGNVDGGRVKEIVSAPAGIYFEEAKYPYDKYIEVIITQQKLKYFENGEKVGETLVSTGIPGFDTPVGTFFVFSKVSSARMTGFYGINSPLNYDLPGVPWVMSFSGGYTLHGTYWHNNFGNQMSHGCVNLPTPKAYEVYMWADIGTPVVIHY
ncbi:MAG: L,D-transpeptidase family protein [Patescibacteria group bacterium]